MSGITQTAHVVMAECPSCKRICTWNRLSAEVTGFGRCHCGHRVSLIDALSEYVVRAMCYSDHNEDIRTKGSCDYCRGTETQ